MAETKIYKLHVSALKKYCLNILDETSKFCGNISRNTSISKSSNIGIKI